MLDSIDSDIDIEGEDDEVEHFLNEGGENESQNEVPLARESDSSESDEYDIPLSFYQKHIWKQCEFQSKNEPNKAFGTSDGVLSPWEYFKRYLDDEFFSLGAHCTAQYYHQQTGKIVTVSPAEIKKFFGLHAIMGCIPFPRIHMYWQNKFKVPLISNVMPRDKFYLLRVNFHVLDNMVVSEETKKNNRLWKVQPMIDKIRGRCRAIPRLPAQAYSIDEQMVPFLGRCPVRQFVRNKPRPVGLKNFVLTSSEGTVLDFEIYQGNTTPFEDKTLGLGPSVILHLVKTVPKESFLFFDRYFSTIPLVDKLLSLDIYGTGTIMQNRIKVCTFKPDREMNRGDSQVFVRNDKKMCVTKWMDNKSVTMLSSAFGQEPVSNVQRWDKTHKTFKDISCPNVVRMYNQKMGGVDITDQMMEYYRSFFKTRKWTFKLILHLFDLAIVNSWMEYRDDIRSSASASKPKILDLLEFRLNLGEYLIHSGPGKRPRTDEENETGDEEQCGDEEGSKKKRYAVAMPCDDKRFDGFEHWPVSDDLKHPLRCRKEQCDSKSRMRCQKCNVYLCLTKHKNCFVTFHQK